MAEPTQPAAATREPLRIVLAKIPAEAKTKHEKIATTDATKPKRTIGHGPLVATCNQLTVMQCNVRHSATAQAHLLHLLPLTQRSVFLLQEPHIFRNRLTSLPRNFLAFHADETEKPRTAVVVHGSLNPRLLHSQPLPLLSYVTLAKLQGSVASAYCPPKDDITASLASWALVAEDTESQWKLMGADVNAYHEAWGSDNTRHKTETKHSKQWSRGIAVMDWIVSHNAYLLNDMNKATYCSDQGSCASIDISLWWSGSGRQVPTWCVSRTREVTDHFPITIRIDTEALDSTKRTTTPLVITTQTGPPFPFPSRRPRRIASKHSTWESRIKQLTSKLNTASQLTAKAEDTAEHLQDLLDSIWHDSKQNQGNIISKHPWWTEALRQARRQYWEAIKRHTTNSTKAHKKRLTARKKYTDKLRTAKKQSWRAFLMNIKDPWKAYHKYLKGGSTGNVPALISEIPPHSIIPPLQFLRELTASATKPDAKLITQQLRPLDISDHTAHEMHRIWDTSFSEEEVTAAIAATPQKKACGPDGIPPELIHRIHPYAGTFLTRLYNSCKRESTFPSIWKAGDAFLLPKSGKEQQRAIKHKDVRAITLLPVLGKVLERLILSRLLKCTALTQVTTPQQHGFTHSRSCYTAILTLVDSLQDSLGKGDKVAAVFLDVAGAFDRAPHHQIIQALQWRGIPSSLTQLIVSYLGQRLTRFTWQDTELIARLRRGTPQGGVLSPSLWNLYLDTLLLTWDNNEVQLHAYADDMVLWASAPSVTALQSTLQKALKKLEDWSQTAMLEFQPSKCTVMSFKYKREAPAIRLQMQGQPLQQQSTTRYLGVIIDSKLSWLPHIRNLVPRISKYGARFLPTIRQSHPVSKHAARRIYMGALLPALSFGHAAWISKAREKHTHKLILRATRPYMLAIARCPPLTSYDLLPKLTLLPSLPNALANLAVRLLLQNNDLFQRFVQPWLQQSPSRQRDKPTPIRRCLYSLLEPHKEHITSCQKAGLLPLTIRTKGFSVCTASMDRTGNSALPPTNRQLRKYVQLHVVVGDADSNCQRGIAFVLVPHTAAHFAALQWEGATHMEHLYEEPIVRIISTALRISSTKGQQVQQEPKVRPTTRMPRLRGLYCLVYISKREIHWLTTPLLEQQFTKAIKALPSPPLAAHVHGHCGLAARSHILTTLQLKVSKAAAQNEKAKEWPPSDLVSHLQSPTEDPAAELKKSIKDALTKERDPSSKDNTGFRTFFRTQQDARTYLKTARTSWALGQLFSGQHPLAKHLYSIRQRDTPMCRTCQTQEESIEHFIFECKEHLKARAQMQEEWNAYARDQTAAGRKMDPLVRAADFMQHPRTIKILDRYLCRSRRFFVDPRRPAPTTSSDQAEHGASSADTFLRSQATTQHVPTPTAHTQGSTQAPTHRDRRRDQAKRRKQRRICTAVRRQAKRNECKAKRHQQAEHDPANLV